MKPTLTLLTVLLLVPLAALHAAEPLWLSEQPVPKAAEISGLKGVQFRVIKANEPKIDGYKWLHGVALAWHKGKLYASFGNNKGSENTTGEEARGRVSADGGKTWARSSRLPRRMFPTLASATACFFPVAANCGAFTEPSTATS